MWVSRAGLWLPLVLALSWLTPAVFASDEVAGFDLGFLASRDVDLLGHDRNRVAGPFFERRTADDGRAFTALRPLVSRLADPPTDRDLRELLWPIGMRKDFGGETDWRFLNAFGHDFDNTDRDSRYRYSLFPIVFGGRDKQQEGYFAVFPIGGTIHEFLGRDRILFVLFPLYARSAVNEVVTQDVLWPVVSWTKGDDVSRFRVFPFYGKSVNAGRWSKRFVLWPVWTSVRYDYPESPGGGFILFPLFGHTRTTGQESWMAVPPLFRWSRSEERRVLNCPWPFFQYSSGDINKLYLWPLWGRKTVVVEKSRWSGVLQPAHGGGATDGTDRPPGRIKSAFFLWPVVNAYEAERGGARLRRFRVAPVFFSESTAAMPAEGQGDRTQEVVNRYVKVWPLGSYLREKDNSLFRTLDLWPLKRTGGIERNYAPLWTLYSRVRVGGAVEDELLWGLFRHRRDDRENRSLSLFPLFSFHHSAEPERVSQWSVLGGVLGCRREGLRKTRRLLYFVKIPSRKDAP